MDTVHNTFTSATPNALRNAKPQHTHKLLMLVMNEAKKWSQVYPELEMDIISEGRVIVYEHMVAFEQAKSVKTPSLYSQCVREVQISILNFVRDNFSDFKLESNERSFFRRYWEIREVMNDFSCDPLNLDLVRKFNFSDKYIYEVEAFFDKHEKHFHAYEALILRRSIPCKLEEVYLDNKLSLDVLLHQIYLEEQIEAFKCHTTEREMSILILRYLKNDLTLDEIGDFWGATLLRVRQMEAKAFKKIRLQINKLYGTDYMYENYLVGKDYISIFGQKPRT